MSSFSPPPFSSSPPNMRGFSPPPMDNFSPPPMSSFSPPPINGFSPPPLEDSDDVLGDHFGLRRHSDMSDDNSFDLTGFSEKMKKIEIEKIKHLPPREILEIQRESLGEKREIFVSLNGLDLETEQKHKTIFSNNQSQNCPSANNKTKVDDTVIYKLSEGMDEARVTRKSTEVENGNKSDDIVGDVLDEFMEDGGDFNEPEPLVFGDLSDHEAVPEPSDFDEFKTHNTLDVNDVCDQQIVYGDNLNENKDLVANSELDSLGESESKSENSVEPSQPDLFDEGHVVDDPSSLDENVKAPENKALGISEATFDDQLRDANDDDLQFGEDLQEPSATPIFVDHSETELNSDGAANEMSDCFNSNLNSIEVPHEQDIAFDTFGGKIVSEKDDSDDFDAFHSCVEKSDKDSHGFETNWNNAGSKDPSDWGNVESEDPCDWGNIESGNPSYWVETADETSQQVEAKSTNIEFDSDDDDDFGDFGDADDNFGDLSQSVPAPVAAPSHNSNATKQSQIEFDDLVVKLLPKVSTVIINMYETVIVEDGLEDEEEDATENLVQNVLNDPVIWASVEDPSTAPALDYTWLQSSAYATLLNTLNIDTRNVLDGEGWTNSRPKFAANLMTPGLLQPLAADCTSPIQEDAKQVAKTKDQVQPAEFDWTNSGLVNPLETDGQKRKATAPSSHSVTAISELPLQKSEPNSSLPLQLPPSQSNASSSVSNSDHCGPLKPSQDHCGPLKPSQDHCGPRKPSQDHCEPLKPSQDHCGPLKPPKDLCAPLNPSQDQCTSLKPSQDSTKRKERLSREAAAVLDAFPLLSFMNSPVLTFPVKSVERKGKRKT